MNNEYSSPIITNCTFSSNDASLQGGAIFNYNSSPRVTNCILWNNRASGSTASTSASSFSHYNSSPEFSHCLIANSGGSDSWETAIGIDHGNNLDVDPLFVDSVEPAASPTTAGDLRLQHDSQAANAGDDSAYNLAIYGATDLDGNSRFVGASNYQGA